MKIRTDYLDLLRKLAWNLHSKTGIEWDELYAEICYQYCIVMPHYRQHHGALTTYLYTAINNNMINYIKKEARKVPCVSLEYALEVTEDPSEASIKSLISDLNEDGKFIFEAIITTPKTFIIDSMIFDYKKIVEFGKLMGWKQERVCEGIGNVNTILSRNEINCIIK